jgi:hypothetical protein
VSRLLLLSLLVALAVTLTACEFVKYDNDVATCTVSDGKVEYTIYQSRDSDQTKEDQVSPKFLAACKAIGAGVQR